MRVGDSPLEASFPLRGAIPAGTWGLVGDGIIAGDGAVNVTVRFEVLWRRASGSQSQMDQTVFSVDHAFVRDPIRRFDAVGYSDSVQGMAAAASAGDLLVLRVSAISGDPGVSYILNGDGSTTKGKIPRLDLPPG